MSPVRPRSRPKETKIILGRWGRDEGQGRGGGSAGGGARVPDTLPRLGLFVPGLSLAAGARGEAAETGAQNRLVELRCRVHATWEGSWESWGGVATRVTPPIHPWSHWPS